MNTAELAIVAGINAARAAAGLTGMRPSEELTRAARRHAADMAANPYIVHTGSDGSDGGVRIREAGYSWLEWGEVVGWGFGGDAGRMVEWWLNSPGHRTYLLDGTLREVGVGYVDVPGSRWGHYWVVDFGRRAETAGSYQSYVPVVVAGPVGAQTPEEIDLLAYPAGDGRAYMVQHPGGAQEKFRTAGDGTRFRQVKNRQWEEFWYDDAYIRRGVDTSPGDGQYYRQFEDGRQGARWCPRRMTIGQEWVSPAEHTVQTYWKGDCSPVDHHRNGRTRNRVRLAARHERMTWNGVTVEDVIELRTHTGEGMFFGRGWGLVAWSSAWGQSAISWVLPAHEWDNVPESGCFG